MFEARVAFIELSKPTLGYTYCDGPFSFNLAYFCSRASSLKELLFFTFTIIDLNILIYCPECILPIWTFLFLFVLPFYCL